MNESIFYKPRTGTEMLRAAPPGTALHLYSDLASDPRPPYVVIKSLPRNNIILLQDPDKMTSGHWIALALHPESHEAFFFSSYGGKPDEEKLRWLSATDLRKSRQARNVINDGLKGLALHGWTVHYNDYPFQIEGDKTATCGLWSAAFLNSGANPDEFALFHQSPAYYYSKYVT